jgi:hypothetical protein
MPMLAVRCGIFCKTTAAFGLYGILYGNKKRALPPVLPEKIAIKR